VASATELASAYVQRWQIELAFDELKTHQRGPRTVLRSKSPETVLQEIWGHLCCHFAIRSLMADTAQHCGHDPDTSASSPRPDNPPVRGAPERFSP
jgi:IS4 transposase